MSITLDFIQNFQFFSFDGQNSLALPLFFGGGGVFSFSDFLIFSLKAIIDLLTAIFNSVAE